MERGSIYVKEKSLITAENVGRLDTFLNSNFSRYLPRNRKWRNYRVHRVDLEIDLFWLKWHFEMLTEQFIF